MNKDGKLSETEEQCCLMEWVAWKRLSCSDVDMIYHIPNEGKRSQVTGAILKKMGLRSGFPDIGLACPAKTYHGLYIEMKVKGNKPTKDQTEWLEKLKNKGYKTAVCYSWIEAANTISEYLGIESGLE